MHMNRSLHVGTYFGIPVKIHWSFSFTIVLIGFLGMTNGMDITGTLTFGALVMTLFLCVVLHEYGHALMAKRFGIKTKDIILSPIGGIARLEDLPERPLHEMLIAIAGPLVNIVIAFFLIGILALGFNEPIIPHTVSDHLQEPSDFIRALIAINLLLFFFNLIPAFPMDGGRILRALLAIKLGRSKATTIASVVGRIMSIGFVFYAAYNNQVTLGIIGVFIFLMAGYENRDVQIKSSLKGGFAHMIMRTQWTKIHISETMATLIDIYQRGGERSFLVYDSLGYIVGGVPEAYIIDAIKNKDDQVPVVDRLSDRLAYATSDTPLLDIYQSFALQKAALILIKEEHQVLGIIDKDILGRYMDTKS